MASLADSEMIDSLSLDSEESFVDLFNSGSLDLQGILDDSDIEMPSNTVSAPAVAASPKNEKKDTPAATPSGPSREELEKLSKIEEMLFTLEGKINEINSSSGEEQQNAIDGFEAVTRSTPMDDFENLNKSQEATGPVVEVLDNKSVLNSKEFNKEVLTKLTEQKSLLIKERENILKAHLNNYQTNNSESVDNIFNQNEQNNNNITETSSVPATPAQESNLNLSTNNTQNLENNTNQNFESFEGAENILQQNTENQFEEKSLTSNNFEDSNSSVFNTNNTEGSNIFNTETENYNTTPGSSTTENIFNTDNITNNTNNTSEMQNLIGEPQEGGSPEGFFTQQSNQSELPQPESEVGGNAVKITALLEGIKQGIDGLSSGLGNNFANLSRSMEGMRNTVINNSYNSGGGQGSSQAPQSQNNNTAMRENIPDYRLDHAFPDDVPAGIVDATRMQGTNLPNPTFIL